MSDKTPVLAYAYILSPQYATVIEYIESKCGFRVKRMTVRSNEDPVGDILSQLPQVHAVISIDCFCYIGHWVTEEEIDGKWYGIYNIPPWSDTYNYIALPPALAEEVREQAPWLPMYNTTTRTEYKLGKPVTVVLGHVAIILYTDLPLDKAVELKQIAPWLKVRVIEQGKIYNIRYEGAEVQEVPLCAT